MDFATGELPKDKQGNLDKFKHKQEFLEKMGRTSKFDHMKADVDFPKPRHWDSDEETNKKGIEQEIARRSGWTGDSSYTPPRNQAQFPLVGSGAGERGEDHSSKEKDKTQCDHKDRTTDDCEKKENHPESTTHHPIHGQPAESKQDNQEKTEDQAGEQENIGPLYPSQVTPVVAGGGEEGPKSKTC